MLPPRTRGLTECFDVGKKDADVAFTVTRPQTNWTPMRDFGATCNFLAAPGESRQLWGKRGEISGHKSKRTYGETSSTSAWSRWCRMGQPNSQVVGTHTTWVQRVPGTIFNLIYCQLLQYTVNVSENLNFGTNLCLKDWWWSGLDSKIKMQSSIEISYIFLIS